MIYWGQLKLCGQADTNAFIATLRVVSEAFGVMPECFWITTKPQPT